MKCLSTLLFCVLINLAAGQSSSAPKPPLGVPATAKLFNGKWYHVFHDDIDWSRAKAKCADAGGQLAVIHDAPTWAFVKTLTPSIVWLGATDEKVEGEWVWVDGTKMDFKAWGREQPNNLKGEEHYLVIWKGMWNDARKMPRAVKANPVVGYICEWKVK